MHIEMPRIQGIAQLWSAFMFVCEGWKRKFRETCLLAFTEMWLGERDGDQDLHITGFGHSVRLGCSPLLTNKSKGGGVCFYMNERYYNTVVVLERICSTDIELLSISLHSSCLPKEFPHLFFSLVYIHLRADVQAACLLIADMSNRLNALSPKAP